jgi:hypothetical protein
MEQCNGNESVDRIRQKLLAKVQSGDPTELQRVQDSIFDFVKKLEQRHGGRELLRTSQLFLALIGTEPRGDIATQFTRADQEICDFVDSL